MIADLFTLKPLYYNLSLEKVKYNLANIPQDHLAFILLQKLNKKLMYTILFPAKLRTLIWYSDKISRISISVLMWHWAVPSSTNWAVLSLKDQAWWACKVFASSIIYIPGDTNFVILLLWTTCSREVDKTVSWTCQFAMIPKNPCNIDVTCIKNWGFAVILHIWVKSQSF